MCVRQTRRALGLFKKLQEKLSKRSNFFYRAVQVLELTFPAFKIVGAVAPQSAASCCSAPTEQRARRPGRRDANLDRNGDIFFCVIFFAPLLDPDGNMQKKKKKKYTSAWKCSRVPRPLGLSRDQVFLLGTSINNASCLCTKNQRSHF